MLHRLIMHEVPKTVVKILDLPSANLGETFGRVRNTSFFCY